MTREAARLEHVASRILGRPLLILPQKLDIIVGVLAGRLGLDLEAPELGLEVAERPEPLASRFVGTRSDKDSGKWLPYQRTDAGAAIITVTGSLVNRGAWVGASSGLTSYEGIAAQIRAAMADPKVKSLLLDLNTPGGEATGAFELSDLVRQANATKPVTALVNGMAASAGYMMASGAGRIVSVPSGITGSIGVVMMHADYSRALDRAGITPTLIHAGKHKVEGNPYEPLDPDTKTRLQGEVEAMREDFVQAVAVGRGGRMSAKAARDTEAAIFHGKDAMAVGLVDDIATFDALFDDMNRGPAARRPAASRGASMDKDYTKADLDAARVEGHAAGLADGQTKGAADERARIKAIVGSPEAKGREGLATHFAYDTAVTPEIADAALKVASKTASGSLAERAAAAQVAIHTAGTVAGKPAPVTIDASAIYAERNKIG